MKVTIFGGLVAFAVSCLATVGCAQTPAADVSAAMQGELATEVQEGCKSELGQYCSQVTPGEGRVLACLFAYEDKLSGQCEYALYDSAVRLERAINAITYVASECEADIETHCADIEVGEGRIANCLKSHDSQLSAGCGQALTDVGAR